MTFLALFNLGCGFTRSIRTFSLCLRRPLPLLVAHAAAPNDPMYRLLGISRITLGVEEPEAGVGAFETSDSVRLSELAIVIWTDCGRDWRVGTGDLEGIVLQDPSKYKLMACIC